MNTVIQTWEDKVRKIHNKTKHTQEELDTIQKYMIKDYYTLYVVRKHQKINMLTESGITKPQVLDYAEMIYKVIQDLKVITKLANTIDLNIVRNTIRTAARDAKIGQSLVGEETAAREAIGVLKLYETYYNLNRKLQNLNPKKFKTQQEQEIQEEQLKEMMNNILNCINRQEQQYQEYAKIKKQYDQGG